MSYLIEIFKEKSQSFNIKLHQQLRKTFLQLSDNPLGATYTYSSFKSIFVC